MLVLYVRLSTLQVLGLYVHIGVNFYGVARHGAVNAHILL
jgi:hypothetical protein